MSDRLAAVQNRVGIGGRSKVLAEAVKTFVESHETVDVITVSDKSEFELFREHYGIEEESVRHRQYARALPMNVGTVYEQLLLAYLSRDALEQYDIVFNSNNCVQFLPETPVCINYVHQPIPAVPHITERYRDSLFLQAYGVPLRLIGALGPPSRLSDTLTVTNSVFVAKQFEKHFDQRPRGVVYPPCIESVSCSPTADSGVVSLGAFHPNKRQLFQIEVAERLPETQFTIVGRVKSDQYYKRCEKAVRERGLDNVRLLPNAADEEVERALNENRIFLHSMKLEEFGISIVEAINHGCIPVVHDSGGPREIVTAPELRFRTPEECIESIRTYSSSEPAFWAECPEHLEEFTVSKFRRRIRSLVEEGARAPGTEEGSGRDGPADLVRSVRRQNPVDTPLDGEAESGSCPDTGGTEPADTERVEPGTVGRPVYWRTNGLDGVTSVGVVGAGFAATNIHLPLLSEMEETTVSYVADIDRSAARSAGRQYGLDWFVPSEPAELPDTDAVVITIPVGVRAQYIEAFGERGIPLFIEKPYALDPDTHRAFDAVDVPTCCNYMRTCYSTTRQVADIVASGAFGDLRRVEIREEGKVHGTEIPPDHYQADSEVAGGGILSERGSHVLSQVVAILGSEFGVSEASIEWNGDFDAATRATLDSPAVEDDITIRLSRIDPVGNVALFEFDRATVTFDPVEPSSRVTVQYDHSDTGTVALEPDRDWATSNHQAVYIRWRQFLSLMCGSPIAPPNTAPEITETIHRIYELEGTR